MRKNNRFFATRRALKKIFFYKFIYLRVCAIYMMVQNCGTLQDISNLVLKISKVYMEQKELATS